MEKDGGSEEAPAGNAASSVVDEEPYHPRKSEHEREGEEEQVGARDAIEAEVAFVHRTLAGEMGMRTGSFPWGEVWSSFYAKGFWPLMGSAIVTLTADCWASAVPFRHQAQLCRRQPPLHKRS